jgi:hypothetical protein
MNHHAKTTAAMRETSRHYRRPYRPALIALINMIATALRSRPPYLDAVECITAAMKQTGLNNFGDTGFRRRLDLLIDAINGEACLNPVGAFMVRHNLIRMLANRLVMEDDIAREPAIASIAMEDPVFVVGLQRTGTTALQRLLASDTAAFRHLASWEAVSPAPRKGRLCHDRTDDPRIAATAMARRALQYLAPDFFAIHPVQEQDPEEDCLLFDYDFWSTVPEATMRVPSFSRWLQSQDHTDAYRYYGSTPGGGGCLKRPSTWNTSMNSSGFSRGPWSSRPTGTRYASSHPFAA